MNFEKCHFRSSGSLKLFQGTDAIGKTIEIKGEPFIVVGIVELASTSQPVIHSIEDYYYVSSRPKWNGLYARCDLACCL